MPPTPSLFEGIAATGSDFDLWMAVAQAIPGRREEVGEQGVTRIQQIAWSVWAASGVIGNGGFWDQDEYLDEWAAGFEALGVPEAARAIRAAPELMRRVRAGDHAAETEYDLVEKAFYSADKKTERLVAELVRANPVEAFAGLEYFP